MTTIGSQRKETVIGRNSGEYDGKPYGGFYTQDEIRDVIAYAKERFVTIIPEIDLPGHQQAALAAYPDLGCTGGPYEVWTQWGISDDVICAGNDKAMQFLEDVLSEVIDLFPSEYIHIGGDECPKVRWKTCPKCQARIKAEGIKGDQKHSAEEYLQSYVISRMEKFVESKGRHIIGWDEILEGGLAPNATVMSWRGVDGGIEAAKQHCVFLDLYGSFIFIACACRFAAVECVVDITVTQGRESYDDFAVLRIGGEFCVNVKDILGIVVTQAVIST